MSDTNLGELMISVPNLTDGRYEALNAYTIEPGKNYVVLVDGVSYEAVGKCYDDSRYGQVDYIGNLSFVSSGGDTGEPFVIYHLFMEGLGYYCRILTNPIANSIECYKREEIKTEPLKFIKFLASPNFPFLPKNIWGWQLAKRRTGETQDTPIMVYGVEWDYSQSSTKLARTDDAVAFASPAPATDLVSVGTSPFDNVMPWAGMKREQIGTDEMVYIPEFYFRVEDDQTNSKMKWQITAEPKDGFAKHPGSGRYVSRYHASAGYASVSGGTPIGGMTRADARNNCHAKGSNWWMLDIATWSAIQILYLVEFADWDCQTTLGGGQTSGSIIATGDTDSAVYHTIKRNRASNQYRWIENPYSNIRDWVDGNTMVNNRVYACTDNSAFNDSNVTDYIDTGLTIALGGSGAYITGLSISEAAPWMFIPTSASGGSATTYIPDHVMSGSGYTMRVVGGAQDASGPWGLFKFDSNDNVSFAVANLGSRLIYIP